MEGTEVEKFLELFKRRDGIAAEWKRSGRKVVGCISTYTPEEIIYAAEALPVEVIGRTETFSKAPMRIYLTSLAPSCVDSWRCFLKKDTHI
jgi:benzoyl-CoA reductase/2-hydroxyglutaryl-CoA dehydratase subunit BcrC/BadD/HgdB